MPKYLNIPVQISVRDLDSVREFFLAATELVDILSSFEQRTVLTRTPDEPWEWNQALRETRAALQRFAAVVEGRD